jgi:large subunit ribosomal protein L23
MQINEIVIRPLLTEKTTNLAKNNFYGFLVNKKANKFQIKTVLEKLYSVKVAEIKIVNRKGKKVRRGRFLKEKKLPDSKVAYVKLIKGSFDFFPKA